jgi:hypothetical protein
MLVRLSAASGVDTTSALLEVSEDLQDADTCVAPVVGITHTSSKLKNAQSMSLLLLSEGEVTIDVTVVVANNSTDSIYYYSSYTLNAVGAVAEATVVNPVCEVCGAGLTISKPDVVVYNPLTVMNPTCAEIEAGGQAGMISPAYCSVLPGVIATACGCELASRTGEADADETTSSPTMAPMSGATGQQQQQQTLVALAVSGLVAVLALW